MTDIETAKKLLIENGYKIVDLSTTAESLKERIIEAIQQITGIDITKNTKSRKRELIEARFIFYSLMRKHTNITLYGLADILGQDHTSVLNGIKKADDYCKVDEYFCEKYTAVESIVCG